MGSTAKSAVADAALGLYKEQGKAGAVLKVTGRDIEEQELALSWDVVTCCWQLEGTVEEVSLRGRKGDVLAALRDAGDALTLTELASLTNLDKRNLLPHPKRPGDGWSSIERCAKLGREVPYRLREGS